MPPKMFSDDYVYLLAPSSLLSGSFGQLKLSLAELPLETAWALPPFLCVFVSSSVVCRELEDELVSRQFDGIIEQVN